MSSNNTKKILLVEDEESLILLYSTLLEKSYSVATENNMEDAENALHENDFDLVLLDIIIPPHHKDTIDYSKRTGFELLDKLKKDDKFSNLKIIVITNLESQEDRNLAMKLGADDYIVKSDVIPKKILETIKKTLGDL